jgi:hypothetical protein
VSDNSKFTYKSLLWLIVDQRSQEYLTPSNEERGQEAEYEKSNDVYAKYTNNPYRIPVKYKVQSHCCAVPSTTNKLLIKRNKLSPLKNAFYRRIMKAIQL